MNSPVYKLGAVMGAAYGDAIGKSTEFMTKWQVNRYYGNGDIVLGNVHRDEHRDTWDPYDWTDDTDQSVLVFQSVGESLKNKDDAGIIFSKKLLDWYHHGFPELGDNAGCGVGISVRWVLVFPNFENNPTDASYKVWKSTDGFMCEDGAIMRTWAIGCFDLPRDVLIDKAISICKITHYDPRCVASCIFITLCVNMFIYHSKDIKSVFDSAASEAEKFVMTAEYLNDSTLEYSRDQYLNKFKKYLKRGDVDRLDDVPLDKGRSRSSTKNPLACAVYAMRNMHLGYNNIIQHIIKQGGDADTNAIVAGAIVGAYYGIDVIPEDHNKMINAGWLKKIFNIQ